LWDETEQRLLGDEVILHGGQVEKQKGREHYGKQTRSPPKTNKRHYKEISAGISSSLDRDRKGKKILKENSQRGSFFEERELSFIHCGRYV
jgi:hypothetical protein